AVSVELAEEQPNTPSGGLQSQDGVAEGSDPPSPSVGDTEPPPERDVQQRPEGGREGTPALPPPAPTDVVLSPRDAQPGPRAGWIEPSPVWASLFGPAVCAAWDVDGSPPVHAVADKGEGGGAPTTALPAPPLGTTASPTKGDGPTSGPGS
ncbi:unnamed protein product, partial [Laminaria digitata]